MSGQSYLSKASGGDAYADGASRIHFRLRSHVVRDNAQVIGRGLSGPHEAFPSSGASIAIHLSTRSSIPLANDHHRNIAATGKPKRLG
jgi:hypothetical protein